MRCQHCGKIFDKIFPERIIYLNDSKLKVCPECYTHFGGIALK